MGCKRSAKVVGPIFEKDDATRHELLRNNMMKLNYTYVTIVIRARLLDYLTLYN